jgi:hypothetical protein
LCGNFRDAISAAGVMRCGQDYLNTSRLNGVCDLLAVSRDNNAVHISRRTRTLCDPTNHGFASNIDESFSR